MSQEAIGLLTAIRDHLASIDASMRELVAKRRATAPKEIASDRDLDGKWGNPEVKFMPRDWTGPSYKGRRFSECPPDLLDRFATTFDWFADQADQKNERTNKGELVSKYKRADAARARGWAQRIRTGKHVQAAGEPSGPATGWAEGETDTEDTWATTGVGDGF
jgi:hypothetical protein